MRSNDPSAERSGCVHTRMFGLGSGHQFCESKGDTGVGGDRGGAGTTERDPLRQRSGVNQSALPSLVCGTADRVGAHSAGQANAKRARGKLSWTAARRMLGSKLVPELIRCAAEDRSMAKGIQRRKTAQQFGTPDPEGICSARRKLLRS